MRRMRGDRCMSVCGVSATRVAGVAWAIALLAPGAFGQLAVGEITGTFASGSYKFHGYVALLDFQAFRFVPMVRDSADCDSQGRGFAPLVTTADWKSTAGVFLAVNGSFSLPEDEYKPGDCLQIIGPVKSKGRLIASGPSRPDQDGNPALMFDSTAKPSIGMAKKADVDAASNVISGQWQTCAVPGPGCTPVLKNGTLLIRQGQKLGGSAFPSPGQITSRTAAGLTRDGVLILIVIEGHLPDSDGIGLPDLADVLAAFQAFDAVNFDGGGSSTMIYTPSAAMPVRETAKLYALMKAAQLPISGGVSFNFTQRDPGVPFVTRPTETLGPAGAANRLYRPVVSHFGFRLLP